MFALLIFILAVIALIVDVVIMTGLVAMVAAGLPVVCLSGTSSPAETEGSTMTIEDMLEVVSAGTPLAKPHGTRFHNIRHSIQGNHMSNEEPRRIQGEEDLKLGTLITFKTIERSRGKEIELFDIGMIASEPYDKECLVVRWSSRELKNVMVRHITVYWIKEATSYRNNARNTRNVKPGYGGGNGSIPKSKHVANGGGIGNGGSVSRGVVGRAVNMRISTLVAENYHILSK